MCTPNCDAPPLATAAQAVVMSARPTARLTSQKMFSDFLGVFLEIRFRWNKCAAIWKICEKHFFTGKKSDFKFQNRGYFGKKMFREFLENSVIISL